MEHVLRLLDLSSDVWEGLTCVAGVKRGRGRGDLGSRGRAREKGKETSSLLPRARSRALIPFPFPFERLPRRLGKVYRPCLRFALSAFL